MTDDTDIQLQLQEVIGTAIDTGTPLAIRGGGSKAFYGRDAGGQPLETGAHRGVVSYEPTELVITARCGTPLEEIERILADQHQFLPFEPPHFQGAPTLGGAVACGLSGPRRPFAGAVRDSVLGVRCLNGKGELLHFGGEVMKNVAGYDLSRLMAGALGTLGVLLEISLKVLPRPAAEITLARACDPDEALTLMNDAARRPLPASGACHDGERLYLRLSGSAHGVEAARRKLGGERIDDGGPFWEALRDHTLPFFQGDAPLWRLSLPPAASPLPLPGETFIDWGGAQRWLRTRAPSHEVREAAGMLGGHATLFRGGDRKDEVFDALPGGLMALHRRMKEAFDPFAILNRGRMYAGL